MDYSDAKGKKIAINPWLASLKYINKSQGSIILVLIKKMSTFYDRFDYLEFDENPGSEN